MRELSDILRDWYPIGGTDAFSLWELWRDSEYKVLPFAGGWLDQPAWVHDDFLMFNLMAEWHYLNKGQPKVSPMMGRFEDL